MNITEKKIMIHLTSIHSGMTADADDDGSIEAAVDGMGELETESEKVEIDSEGILRLSDERVEIEYFESELTGMEGSCTSIFFDRANSGLITMLRTGSVETVLVFEAGQRNACAYNAGVMAFEITVRTWDVRNDMTDDGGEIELDYSLEFRGASTEHTKIMIGVTVVD